jgi:hypothetical protein
MSKRNHDNNQNKRSRPHIASTRLPATDEMPASSRGGLGHTAGDVVEYFQPDGKAPGSPALLERHLTIVIGVYLKSSWSTDTPPKARQRLALYEQEIPHHEDKP